MASAEKTTTMDSASGSARYQSPPAGLRQRPLGRAATFAEPAHPLTHRRSSTFSETLSEARKSLKSSTDDLLLPKIAPNTHHETEESSHWHSLPLGLALLPALGGLIFKDGSAVVTDITLLVLAGIFMNWALRMPWDWYHGAQSTYALETASPLTSDVIVEEEEEDHASPESASKPQHNAQEIQEPQDDEQNQDVRAELSELRIHEMLALFSCFILPALATWVLHAIRSQLSRPSEGLVSNFNLTIFLMVAEIRPVSHLIKLIQRRTLFLQRRLNLERLSFDGSGDNPKVQDLSARIEELESHVANGIATKASSDPRPSAELLAKTSADAATNVKKAVQPELDALSRAMRRYEKRSTISAVQVEARLQDLEGRLKDVVALAAAAQRNAEQRPQSHFLVLMDWLSALIVVPVQFANHLLSLPMRILSPILNLPQKYFPALSRRKRSNQSKGTRKVTKSQSRERDKKSRGVQ